MDPDTASLLPLAHLPYAEQLQVRSARVADALRNGRIEAEVSPIVPSPLEVGSRARLKLRAEHGRLGFHRPGSHAWFQPDLAVLARPELVAAVGVVEAWGRARGEVELRSDGVGVVADRPLGPLPSRPQRILGLRASPRSFTQVNLEINARIVADVDAVLAELAPVTLLDLFGGIGNLSAGASKRGPVVLIERDGSSVADARVNLPQAKVVAGDALRFSPGDHFFDVALLDPPRAGAPGLLPKLLVTRPRAVVYLSCEPTTLARDLRPLLDAGFRLDRVQPYDMFPGTDHVETLVVATR